LLFLLKVFYAVFCKGAILPNSSAVREFCYNRALAQVKVKASEVDAMQGAWRAVTETYLNG